MELYSFRPIRETFISSDRNKSLLILFNFQMLSAESYKNREALICSTFMDPGPRCVFFIKTWPELYVWNKSIRTLFDNFVNTSLTLTFSSCAKTNKTIYFYPCLMKLDRLKNIIYYINSFKNI